MIKVELSEFEKLVKQALLDLPPHIFKEIDNAVIVVEDKPPRQTLLGLYQGVPKTVWGRGFGQILPDKITIFQEPIQKLASTPEDIREIVKMVVWHEVAHHFGFDEKGVRKLEAKWRQKKKR